jgi:hypothetical protein
MKEYNIKYETNATLVLTMPELISILKSVLIDSLNIDLDKLGVNVLVKYSNNRIHMTLDAELIRHNSVSKYIQFINDVKRVLGPYIFTVSTAIDFNVLINSLFSGYDYYTVNKDMIIEIYY